MAEQEENIKRLRVVEEAERTRQALVIQAEAEAQENLVKDIKAAEAAEAAAKHRAREELVLAEARQQAAELDTRAKIRWPKASRPRRRGRAGRGAGPGAQRRGDREGRTGRGRRRAGEGRGRRRGGTREAQGRGRGSHREGRRDGRARRRDPGARGVPTAPGTGEGGPAGRAGHPASGRRGAGQAGRHRPGEGEHRHRRRRQHLLRPAAQLDLVRQERGRFRGPLRRGEEPRPAVAGRQRQLHRRPGPDGRLDRQRRRAEPHPLGVPDAADALRRRGQGQAPGTAEGRAAPRRGGDPGRRPDRPTAARR